VDVYPSFSLYCCSELIALFPQAAHTLADMVNNDGTPRCKIIKSIFFFYLLTNKEKSSKQRPDLRYFSLVLAIVMSYYSCPSESAPKASQPNSRLQRGRGAQPQSCCRGVKTTEKQAQLFFESMIE